MRKLLSFLLVAMIFALPAIAANMGSLQLLSTDTVKTTNTATIIIKLNTNYPDTTYWRVGVVSWETADDSVKGDVKVYFAADTAVAQNPLGIWTPATALATDRTTSDSTQLDPLSGYPAYSNMFNYMKITITGKAGNDVSAGSVWKTYLIKKLGAVAEYP